MATAAVAGRFFGGDVDRRHHQLARFFYTLSNARVCPPVGEIRLQPYRCLIRLYKVSPSLQTADIGAMAFLPGVASVSRPLAHEDLPR